MKKMPCLLLSFAAMLFVHMAVAQEVLLDAKRIKSEELPPAVQDSLRKHFPQERLSQVLQLPLKVYKSDWEVLEKNTMPDGEKADYYSVDLINTHGHVNAVYDKNGHLIQAKEHLKNAALPNNLTTYIAEVYPGYSIQSDAIRKVIRPDVFDAKYEVKITKGNEKKRLIFNSEGKITNVK